MAEERLLRRLAAVLSADVVGYSHLMGIDEAGTLARLKVLRREIIDPTIVAHSGRIVKLMGDGSLVEFGSAVDAVMCAIAIQKKVREHSSDRSEANPIRFRIGINVGDIIIDGEDIYGDGVNIAARLEGIAEPGGIFISEDAWRQVRGKVATDFVDVGDHSLKNIAQPVHVYRVLWLPSSETVVAETRPVIPLPDKPSIAVLPFRVLQGTADDEAFADGLTEDIITALSRIRALFVIARNSSFTYKGKSVDTRQICRELGVGYILEGSIRRSGDRLRVTAQLIEAESGNHVWAEKYDRPVSDIFDLQDDLTRSVAASTQVHIALEEGAHVEAAERPDLNVWLLIKRSWRRLHDLTPEALAEARSLAERALGLAPESGLAHEVLSAVLVHQVFMYTDADARATLAKARDEASKAARLEGSSEYAYWALGMVQFSSREPDQAVLTLRHGLEINPNCALLHATVGNYLALMGQADESIAATELSMRINPRDPSIFFRYQALADACFVKRDYERMVAWAAKGVGLKPSYFGCHLRLIVGLALLGRLTEARAAVKRYLRDVPDEIRSRVHSFGFVRDDDRELFRDGVKIAGLLE
jgi:adenylate cyclase